MIAIPCTAWPTRTQIRRHFWLGPKSGRSQSAKVDDKIRELELLHIIECVGVPTTWVSPLDAVPKPNGEVRVCADMRQANEAVLRKRHPIPTVEETLQALHEAAVFSKLDLRWGYHQSELNPESQVITTSASTHQGLWRYKRLMFGISSAPEAHHTLLSIIQWLPRRAEYLWWYHRLWKRPSQARPELGVSSAGSRREGTYPQ